MIVLWFFLMPFLANTRKTYISSTILERVCPQGTHWIANTGSFKVGEEYALLNQMSAMMHYS